MNLNCVSLYRIWIYRAIITVIILIIFNSCERQVSVSSADEIIYYGFIYIDSNPRGASIYLNGKNTGRTAPDSLRFLPAGSYLVNLKLKYYRDTSFTVQLSDPDLKEYFIDYYQNPLMFGNANFTSDPAGAKIILNDSLLQPVTPYSMKNLRPGNYVVEYQIKNYRNAVFNIVVESNKTSSVYYKLRDTSQWVDYQISNSSVVSNLLTCVDADFNNIKWIGSFDKGLISFDGGTFKNFSMTNSPIPSNNITCISIDQNNQKWIGTDAGIAVFDNNSWTIYSKNNSGLTNNNINSIKFEDNITWIGTPSGLVRFDGSNWTLYDTVITKPIVQYAAVSDIAIDKDGYKWLSTSGTGIFKFKNGIFGKAFTDSIPNIPTNSLSSDAIAMDGEKWFGHLPSAGKRGGVSIYNGNSWKNIFIGSEGNLIEDIYVDNSNTKWVATNEGLFQIVGATPLYFYNRNNSLISFSHIKGTVKDDDGIIWIATYGGGLNKLKQ
jgi:hypothetical protein